MEDSIGVDLQMTKCMVMDNLSGLKEKAIKEVMKTI